MGVKVALERSTFPLISIDDKESFVFDSLENLKLDKVW